jgi:hypothetical protein
MWPALATCRALHRRNPRSGRVGRGLSGKPFRLRERRRGRIATKWSIWNTDYRRDSFRSHLLTAWAHGDAFNLHTPCTRGGGPRQNARTRHPSRQSFGTTRRIRPLGAGSHLGSTLNPGGAVLTLGVFRRSRSVAYIRADASPSEVLAEAMVASGRRAVKFNCQTVATITFAARVSAYRPGLSRSSSSRQLPL